MGIQESDESSSSHSKSFQKKKRKRVYLFIFFVCEKIFYIGCDLHIKYIISLALYHECYIDISFVKSGNILPQRFRLKGKINKFMIDVYIHTHYIKYAIAK